MQQNKVALYAVNKKTRKSGYAELWKKEFLYASKLQLVSLLAGKNKVGNAGPIRSLEVFAPGKQGSPKMQAL